MMPVMAPWRSGEHQTIPSDQLARSRSSTTFGCVSGSPSGKGRPRGSKILASPPNASSRRAASIVNSRLYERSLMEPQSNRKRGRWLDAPTSLKPSIAGTWNSPAVMFGRSLSRCDTLSLRVDHDFTVLFGKWPLLRIGQDIQHQLRRAAQASAVGCHHKRPVDQDGVRQHGIKQLVVRKIELIQSQLRVGRALLANRPAYAQPGIFDHLCQLLPAWRMLQIFNDSWLFPAIADHGQSVTGCTASRIVIDGGHDVSRVMCQVLLEADRQRCERDKQHWHREYSTDAEVVSPRDMQFLLVKHVQPKQGRQAADWRDLRPEVAANHVGVDHGFAYHAMRRCGVDGQCTDQHGRHVVHDGRQDCRHEAGSQRCGPEPLFRQTIQYLCQQIRQSRVTQAINHQVHAEGEEDDLPRCPLDHLSRRDHMSPRGYRKKNQRTGGGYRTDGNTQAFQPEESQQEQPKHPPASYKGGFVTYCRSRGFQLRKVVILWNVLPEEDNERQKRSDQRGQVDRDHDAGILRKTELEVVRRNNVDQVRYHQRQAGCVSDEARRHDERQGRLRREPQRLKHGNDDGRQDQCGTVVGKDRRYSGAQQDQQYEQALAVTSSPASHMKRRPFKKTSLVQQQTDDDDGNEGRSSIPDDVPHRWNISPMDYAQGQRHDCASASAPTDAQTPGLPNDQHQCNQENEKRYQHAYSASSSSS
eukprot:TRINITY_DN833_c0_g1_i9.p1 TRINITY_DN833_c0_g1~~TRINITY_DN833_c0_g1_i9.p1  ORF type:complete len:698 (-),score=93.03 TRINITY_DN833_c0_g1_i9:5457-7550(-)